MFPLCEGCLFLIDGECRTIHINKSVETCYHPITKEAFLKEREKLWALISDLEDTVTMFLGIVKVVLGDDLLGDAFDPSDFLVEKRKQFGLG